MKPPAVPPPHYVAAEYVCAELARLIRLPVPPSFVAELPGEEDRPHPSSAEFNLYGIAVAEGGLRSGQFVGSGTDDIPPCYYDLSRMALIWPKAEHGAGHYVVAVSRGVTGS